MSLPPTKTALGLEELRQRTRKLGQRHRTVLLLVDGKRSREEVVGLAQQAGVVPSHFDELIAWGMVDGEPLLAPGEPDKDSRVVIETSSQEAAVASPEPAPLEAEAEAEAAGPAVPAAGIAALAPAVVLEPGHGDPGPAEPSEGSEVMGAVARGSAPEEELAAPEPAGGGSAAPAAAPAAVAVPERLTITLSPPPVARPLPARRLAPSRRGAPRMATVAPRSPEPPALALGLEAVRAVPTLSEPLLGELPSRIRPVFVADAATLDALPTADDADASEESRLLGEVRGLLIGTLLVDAPVSSSLTALRVHRARDRESLVRLVWEVERSLVRARRPREAQARLGRARELLGLGNTVVHEHTLPGHPGGD